MDFSFTEDQEALRGLARRIFEDELTPQRLKEVEATDDRFDRELWGELARAGLLGIALPEEVGGAGLGLVELGILLEEAGRAAAPVPLWPALVLGALPVAAHGSGAQRNRFLPAVAAGEAVLTAALVEPGNDDPARPSLTTATREGGGWRLEGTKTCVPAAHLASCVLVPAAIGGDGCAVFLVDPGAPGVRLERQEATNRQLEWRLELQGVRAGSEDVLGGGNDGAAVVRWIVERAVATLCAMQAGVCERALRMTAEYTSVREQFGRPLAANQAVAQRAADAYIDTEGIRLTAWQAIWRLAEGLPATAEVAVAKFWAAEGGQRVVHAAQHLHGGIGVDVDYPLHRYFLWAKHIELTLGSATQHLLRLGAVLAEEPV